MISAKGVHFTLGMSLCFSSVSMLGGQSWRVKYWHLQDDDLHCTAMRTNAVSILNMINRSLTNIIMLIKYKTSDTKECTLIHSHKVPKTGKTQQGD